MARERRRIAIIGSANKDRNRPDHRWPYDPPLAHPDEAMTACEQLGAALCAGDWDLVVYGGEGLYGETEGFIESAFVTGYVAGSPRAGSIHVLHSRNSPTPKFAEQADHPDAFEFRADLSDRWEPSFFRSLADIDAAVIVGGGNSAYLAGLVCLGRKIPLLAVGTFGAAGERALDAMQSTRIPLREEDLELLGRPDWTQASARQLVDSIDSQAKALETERAEFQRRRQTRRQTQNAAAALTLFVLAVLLIPTALVVTDPDTWPELALLFAGPLIAGASGGTIRSLLPRTHELEIPTLGSAALGAVAGGVSGLIYLTAQITSSTDTALGDLDNRQFQTFVLFSVVIGFVSGLGLDSVYQRLVSAGAAEARDNL